MQTKPKLGKAGSRMDSRQNRSQVKLLLLFKNTANHKALIVYTDGSGKKTSKPQGSNSVRWWFRQKDQSGWGFNAKHVTTTIHKNNTAYTVSTSSSTMKVEAVTHAVHCFASRCDSQTTCHNPPSQWACYKKWKMESETQTGSCHVWYPPLKIPGVALPWICQSQVNWRSRHVSRQSSHHKWLVIRKNLQRWGAWGVERGSTP